MAASLARCGSFRRAPDAAVPVVQKRISCVSLQGVAGSSEVNRRTSRWAAAGVSSAASSAAASSRVKPCAACSAQHTMLTIRPCNATVHIQTLQQRPS